jgi:hypothetical protein
MGVMSAGVCTASRPFTGRPPMTAVATIESPLIYRVQFEIQPETSGSSVVAEDSWLPRSAPGSWPALNPSVTVPEPGRRNRWAGRER